MKFIDFRWRSLKPRVTLFTLAIFLLSMWSLAFFASRMLHADMERVLGEQQFSTVSIVADEVNEEMERRLQALENVSRRVTPAILANPAALRALLEEQVILQSLFNGGIYVTRTDGTAIGGLPVSANRIGINYLDRDYLAAALKEGKAIVGRPVVDKSLNVPILGLALPIRDSQGEVIGALAGVINLGQPNFLDKITAGHYGKTGGYLLVAPQHNLIITATDKSRIMQPVPAPGVNRMNDRYMQGFNGFGIALNKARIEELSAAQRVPVAGWFAVVVLPTTEAFAPIHDLRQQMFLTAIFLSLLAGTLTWWMLRRELLPLVTTASTLANQAQANLMPQPLPLTRQDETDQLIGGFNRLLQTLTKREETLKESEQKHRLLVENSHDVIYTLTTAGAFIFVSSAWTVLLGYSIDQVVGQSFLSYVSSEDVAVWTMFMQNVMAMGRPQAGIELRVHHRDGGWRWFHSNAVPLKDETGKVIGLQGSAMDITARKVSEEKIDRLAFYDTLTGLPNRRLLMDRLEQALTAGARHQRQGALLLVDLDDFKSLNDTLGHDKGDLLLQQVAQRLLSCVREGDTVARVGGDEFVVLLEDLSQNPQEAASQAEAVGKKMIAALNYPYQLDSHAQHSTASIGITLFGCGQQEAIAESLKRAELAMYQAKAAGHNTLRFFEAQMQAAVMSRVALEAGLREAVLKNQFIVHYQAQVTDQGRITGVEVLVRWQDPQRGMVSPAEFIPLAEETSLILPLGQWVLEAACKQLALWVKRPEMAHLTVAVNVSARQFHHKDFVDQVLAVLESTGANPKRLKLELTESLLVANVEDLIAKMSTLKGRGVGFSLDDFGTGYSSLSYLKRLPLDQLKIDISFVRDILTNPSDAAIAKTVIDLAENLGLAVIAEGVETEGQRNLLARQGCHAYQGYLFSRPLPLAEFEALAADA